MNVTGAMITAVGTVLTAILTILVGYFVRRTDRVARLNQSNLMDQSYILKLVGTLRDDYWALADWAYAARASFARLLASVLEHGGEQAVADLEKLARIPEPKHRDLEARHAQGLPLDDDGGK